MRKALTYATFAFYSKISEQDPNYKHGKSTLGV